MRSEWTMEAQKEKSALIGTICAQKGTPEMKMMVDFLELLIEEVRISNDLTEEIKYNQGMLKAYKYLRGVILNGMPVMQQENKKD